MCLQDPLIPWDVWERAPFALQDSNAQIRILLQRLPRDPKGFQELSCERSNQVGSFSPVEKPLEMAPMEKRSYCQTRKRFLLCLLIFGAPFWMAFKPKSNRTRQRLPAPLPHPGEQQGWEERGEEGLGLLFSCGSSHPRGAGARLCWQGTGTDQRRLLRVTVAGRAAVGSWQEGTDGLCQPSPWGNPNPCQPGS